MDIVFSMRSYFRLSGVEFARAVIAEQKQLIARSRIVPLELREMLTVTLGDPQKPAGAPLVAYVNDGAWKVKCECGSGELVDLDNPVVMCCSCWNDENGRAWRAVTLPDPETRARIEAALIVRPIRATRNWRPNETVADLERENVEHGVTS